MSGWKAAHQRCSSYSTVGAVSRVFCGHTGLLSQVNATGTSSKEEEAGKGVLSRGSGINTRPTQAQAAHSRRVVGEDVQEA